MPKDDGGQQTAIDNGQDNTGDGNQRAPLKRGDACLYCRKRRIRCTAEKPSCQHCRKLKRECVYDTGKPVSRVKQLEDKVAELEGLLKTSASSNTINNDAGPSNDASTTRSNSTSAASVSAFGSGATPSFGQTPFTPAFSMNSQTISGNATSFGTSGSEGAGQGGNITLGGINSSADFSQMFSAFSNPTPFDNSSSNQFPAGPSGVSQQAVEMFDFSTLDPSFMDLVESLNSTSTTNTTSLPQPPNTQGRSTGSSSTPSMNSGNKIQEMNMESTGLTPFLNTDGMADPFSNTSMQSQGLPQPTPISIQPISEIPTRVSYQAYVTGIPNVMPDQQKYDPQQPLRDGDETMGENSVMGGWFDAADLPKVARDHLLDLFFSRMRFFGQEFHIPRFFASLTLPVSKRPHPCLLYSMYLLACRVSSQPNIRSLEPHFATIALKQLEESSSKLDRTFDAVRAATLLAVYHFGSAHYHEGWMMSGRAARLAIACGLHVIPSSVWRPRDIQGDNGDLVGLMRHRTWMLPPPADAIELGERIWGFWTIFVTDRCGAISCQWPSALPDDIVTTPFPRPLYEYELGLISEADDRSLGSIYSPDPQPALSPYLESTFFAVRMRALTILDRASKLMYLLPEPGWERTARETQSQSPPSDPPTTSPPSWGDDLLTPDQYMAIFGQTPAQFRPPPPQSQGQIPGQAANMNTNPTGTTATSGSGKGWMRTAKVRTPKAYGEVKLALERLEGDLVPEFRTNWWHWDGKTPDWHFSKQNKDLFAQHFMIGCAWMFLFDVFSFNAPNDLAVGAARRMVCTIDRAMNYLTGSEMDVFTIMTWSFISKILIREIKRLHAIGDHRAASPIETDLETTVQALRVFGTKYNLANSQVARAERLRKSTAEDTKFMEGDGYDGMQSDFTECGIDLSFITRYELK